MAEELDEFGIPIKRKSGGDVDEFGIPIKKKTQSNPSESGLATSGGTSRTSSSPFGFAQQANQQQVPFDMSRQANPQLVRDVQEQDLNRQLAQSARLKKINEVYDSSQGESLSKARKTASKEEAQINQGIADEDREGNRASYIYNEVLNGVGSIAAGLGDVGATIMAYSPDQGYSYDGNQPTRTAEQIAEQRSILTDYRANTAPSIRDFLTKRVGADLDKGLKAKYQDETFTAALGGLAQSAPAIAATIASGGVGTGALFLQSYDNALQSIDQTEEGRNLDDATKSFYAGGVGLVVSALEKYGLDKIFKSETGIIGNMIAQQAIKNASRETGGKVTGDVLGRFLDKEVLNLSNKYLKGGIRALDGALIEYTTEGAQEAATAGAELLTNKTTGKPVFDTSNIEDWKGFLTRVNKAGVMGAIGGGLLGGVAGIANLNRADIEATQQSLNDVNTALQNEQLSETAQKVLIENKVKLEGELNAATQKIDDTFNKLDDTQKERVMDITDRKVEIEEALNDPAIPESVKASLTEENGVLEEELKTINPVSAKNAQSSESEIIPVKKGSDVNVDDTVELVNGQRGQVIGVEGDQVTMIMENGSTFMATPDLIEMSVVKPKANETITETEVISTPEENTTEAVQEALDTPVLKKAEDDLTALKQVKDKNKKYQASIKRLNEAFRAGTITEQQFNDTKIRFDDVIADSAPNVPKSTNLSEQEITELDNELKNENLTTNDFIEYERARAIEDATNDAETVQPTRDDAGTSTTETTGSETTQEQKAGDPLRIFASKLREGKINKLGGFRASTGFDGAWDLSIEAVATAIEGGAKVADGIQAGLKAIRQTDWYKGLSDKKGFEDQYVAHLETEYNTEETKATALKNADIATKRDELGLEAREAVPVLKNTRLVEEANEMVKTGYDVEELIDKILDSNEAATAQEVIILKEYQLAKEQELIDIGDKIVQATEQGKGTSLDKLIEDRDQIIIDIDRAYQAGERTGTITARALQARKVALMNDYSLANMLIQKRKANGGEKLSTAQIDEVTSEYNKIKKLNEEFQKKIDELEKQNEKLESEKAFKSIQKILDLEARKNKRTIIKESIDKDLDDAWSSLSKKVKEQSGKLSMNAIPVDLIPDLAKIARLYVKRGITSIDGIVDEMYVNLSNSIDGLTKDDLREVLVNYDYEAADREEVRLEAFKNRTKAKTEELIDRTDRGDFNKRKIEPVKLDTEGLELQKQLRKARYDWELALERDLLNQRNRLEKFRDQVANYLNIPRQLMATLDLSAPLRQGLVLSVNNPIVAGKAFTEMLRQAWSQERFDKWYDDLIETPGYAVMKDSGLYIANQRRAALQVREEQFSSNLVEKIPVVGKLAKGSERAYVGYLNKLRADIFTQGAIEFENEGKTLQNSKQLYEALATYINAATGRGDLGKMENSAQILNSLFFSPRLIASRVRLLTNWANPVWYANTPKEVRYRYIKDMARLIAFGTSILSLASLAGADVEDDPRSSDFAKIRVGDKRWDIWGGFQQFVRFFTQLGLAQRKSTSDKTIREINGEGFKGETRADLILNMVRSKLAPVPATAWNLASGSNLVGEEYTWKDVPPSFLPLFATDLFKASEKDGILGFVGSSVGAFGVGVQDYSKAGSGKQMTPQEMRQEIKKQLDELKKNKEK